MAVAHAWLADQCEPGARRQNALAARAQQALGLVQEDKPLWLQQWCLRLQNLPAPLWDRLDPQRLAQALLGEQSLAAVCYPARVWRAPVDSISRQNDPTDFSAAWQAEEALWQDEEDEPENEALPSALGFADWARQNQPMVRRWLLRPAQMQAAAASLDALALPQWADSQQLAQALGLDLAALQWLATPLWQLAPRGQEQRRLAASHYRHRLIPKRRGGLRLLEVPKQQLAQVQRQLLQQLLQRVPAHEAAHGFVAGRSMHSHAAVHASQAVVCSFDLRDFFHCIGAAQLRALWRSLGYPAGIATQLTALTTVSTPLAVRERLQEEGCITRHQAKRLAHAHLAQGAATSPALANLCAFRLDLRLNALAERFGARYSRYADDLVFSGPASLARDFQALKAWVQGIAEDEGFALHPDKSRCMRSSQQQRVTGLVVNAQPNLPRADYDLLRAQLRQLAQQGNVAPALYAQLQGRVAWACQCVSPARQDKLQALLAGLHVA